MKKTHLSLVFLGFLVSLLICGVISSHYLGDDNEIEEMAETILEQKTGVDIDLTPESIEKNTKFT